MDGQEKDGVFTFTNLSDAQRLADKMTTYTLRAQ